MKSRRLWGVLLVMISISILLIYINRDHRSLEGNWVAKQISQEIGVDNELMKYNYWKIGQRSINLTSFDDVGDIEKKFNDTQADMAYTWNSDKQILLNGVIFDVSLKSKHMTLKSATFEIEFEQAD
ncbi:hypothetical protein [Paenibacillus selenitireducens]|nr:hypothetical protein [Paenibacillus selenitireducens]